MRGGSLEFVNVAAAAGQGHAKSIARQEEIAEAWKQAQSFRKALNHARGRVWCDQPADSTAFIGVRF